MRPAAVAVLLSLGLTACVRLEFEAIPNGAPIPKASAELRVLVGETVVLDGSQSSDPDGDTLTYRWEQAGDSGEPVTLEGASSAAASFQAPARSQRLFFRLFVSDGVLEAPPAVVRVEVGLRPNAVAQVVLKESEISVLAGATVVLDASATTDGDGDTLVFRWEQVGAGGDPVQLRAGGTAVATFTAPDRPQRLFFSVTVSDGYEEAAPSVVRVEVTTRRNDPPDAIVAQSELKAVFGSTVVLDASTSSDADDDALTFHWTQITSGGDIVTLRDPDTAVASFTAPDSPQKLYFSVIVNDGLLDSSPVVVKVEVQQKPNAVPVVVLAETVLEVHPGETVVLDASGSTDTDADLLTFHWAQAGSGADPVNLAGALTAVASFTAPDREQRLFFSVVASDGQVSSVPGVVRVDVVPVPNHRPVAAAAGYELSVPTGSAVILDGRTSSDADGDTLTYKWEQVAATTELVNLVDQTKAVASFTAPPNGARLFIRLTVSDAHEESEPVVVGVSVYSAPQVLGIAPVSTPNQTPVQIKAEATDRDGDPIVGWTWKVKSAPGTAAECVAIPSPCLLGAETQIVSFTPPRKGDYQLEVVASDGTLPSRPLVVVVRSLNRGPGLESLQLSAATTSSGAPVTVTAIGTVDPDGDALDSWIFSSEPAGIFTPVTPGVSRFRPTARGLHRLRARARDALGAEGATVEVNLLVENAPPAAVAGTDATITNGGEIALAGTGSDPDGDKLTFQWRLVDFPPDGRVTLGTPDGPVVRFTPQKKTLATSPAQCATGQCYELELIVNDGIASSPPSRVKVVALNRTPVANAGPDAVVGTPVVTLDGTASSDPDGDTLTTYTWTQVLGLDVTSGAGALSGRTVSFEPAAVGIYKFELVVSDGTAQSVKDDVRIEVTSDQKAPVLVLAATRDVTGEGQLFTRLDASGTSDPNGDNLTFVWTRRSGSTLWPETLAGEKPVLRAPAFDTLLLEGSNAATYEVYAEDDSAVTLRSPVQTVTVFTGPGAAYVVVSNATNANDAATPCGTVAIPCATVRRAFQVIDPEVDRVGNGRAMLLTGGLFRQPWVADGTIVPSGTRIVGGFHPDTFEPGGTSELRVESLNGRFPVAALELPATSTGIILENLRVTIARGASVPWELHALHCTNCRVELRNVELTSVEDASITSALTATGGSAQVTVKGSRLVAARGVWGNTRALSLLNGASATVEDSVLTAAVTPNNTTQALNVENARVVVRRSRLEVTGEATGSPERFQALGASQGIVSVENSILRNVAHQNSYGIQATTGSALTLIYNTIIGAGSATGTGAAVRVTDPVQAVGNLFTDFPVGISLDGANALRSRLYANAFVRTGPNVAFCGAAALTDTTQLNGDTGGTCNKSGSAWSDNLFARCPLVDPAAGDFRLNDKIVNPCIDGGVAASAAGNAPPVDFDQRPRPAVDTRPDIGAYEVK